METARVGLQLRREGQGAQAASSTSGETRTLGRAATAPFRELPASHPTGAFLWLCPIPSNRASFPASALTLLHFHFPDPNWVPTPCPMSLPQALSCFIPSTRNMGTARGRGPGTGREAARGPAASGRTCTKHWVSGRSVLLSEAFRDFSDKPPQKTA